MEQEDFDAKIAKLEHDIEQLDGKLEDKISSLKEELRKWIIVGYLIEIRDVTQVWLTILRLNQTFAKACQNANDEVASLANEYLNLADKVSANELEKNLVEFKADINRITRAAGLRELWEIGKTKV